MSKAINATQVAEAKPAPGRLPYPIGVPLKFDKDGKTQRYPGNTVLCHLPADSPLIDGLHAVQNTLAAHPTLARFVRPLPASSWHMTVLDGVQETESEPNMLPQGLLKEPLADTTLVFSAKLRALGQELARDGLAPPYRMRFTNFSSTEVGIGLEVRGVTDAEEMRMRALRDRLADALGFRAPNHNSYVFHVTAAYLLRHVDGADLVELKKILASLVPRVKVEFDLGAAEFCTFEDMCVFNRLFYLGE